jgi:hypothetical protein
MLKEDFVRRILDGAAPTPKRASKKVSSPATFSADDVFGGNDTTPGSIRPPADTRFAQLLLEEVFGHGEALDRDEVVLGEQKTSRLLPNGGRYWPKSNDRPFQIVLFELDRKGREVLADGLFSRNDLLEDALHRIIQDVLDGFEKPKRAASTRSGAQTETLCVVSLVDDRNSTLGRQLVCFGTKSIETKALEVFTLREEVRDWDRPLAEEHLDQLFERHFKKLASGTNWQDAFITGAERKTIRALLDACTTPSFFDNNEEDLRRKLRDVLDEIAGSFGIWKKSANQGRRLDMVELPVNHGIGADPEESQKPGFKNSLQGVRIYDRENRLLGFVVYVVSNKAKVEPVREALTTNNHFHNVLVIYPDSADPVLELWQGGSPLRGRLTRGTRRTVFDGEGGVVQLLSRFFVVSKSAIEKPRQLATELAWRAKHLKALAVEELQKEITAKNDHGPLKKLFDTFNAALAKLTVEKFADAYAQTITYGMLAARWISSDDENKPLFTRKNLKDLLPETSAFLKDLFDKLVNSNFDKNLSWLLDDITSLLARTSVAQVFQDEKRDPSIHFYEDFLDAYDPQVRKDQGVYYTPDEVVSYIVRTAHASLQTDFGLPLGLADTTTWAAFAKANKLAVPEGVDVKAPFVQVLDPALGTGTFLLRVIEVIHETMQAEFKKQGLDDETARKAWVSYVRKDLLPRINGFELMMAPYIVSHLRLGLALQETGFTFTKNDRLRVFLTNTLEMHTSSQLSFIGEHVAEESKEAERVKKDLPISVIVGNPPYERVAAASDVTSEWVLKGTVPGREGDQSLFDDILDVARKHTIFSHHASLYDRYVYFWRWAMWRTLERPGAPGLVGFITNSTWLTGPGFVGLRQLARQNAELITTLDLGGDNRGTHPEPNVFNVKTPVAITTMARVPSTNVGTPARAVYRRVGGASRQEKLDAVNALMDDIGCAEDWKLAPIAWMSELSPPTGGADWLAYPALEDLFPWQQPGCMHSRSWPISPSSRILEERWKRFASSSASERPDLYVTPTSGRSILTRVPGYERLVDLTSLSEHEPIVRFGYRAFDRQWTLDDPRLAKTESPSLWRSRSESQVFLVSLMTVPIAAGPAIVVSAHVPDKHYFRGSFGGKDIIPVWRDAEATTANITKGLLERIGKELGTKTVSPEDLAAYVYAILSALRYQARFVEALKTPGPRVPLTRDAELWSEAVELGKELLWLHTYAERFRSSASGRSSRLPKVAGLRWTKPVSQMPARPSNVTYDEKNRQLLVGDGVVAGVRKDVMDYSVSGMEVVWKWLGYRTAKGAGRAASSSNPLDQIRATKWPDDWNNELIELLTVLTVTLDKQPAQRKLLDAICDGPLIPASELPTPTDAERKEPKVKRGADLFEDDDE